MQGVVRKAESRVSAWARSSPVPYRPCQGIAWHAQAAPHLTKSSKKALSPRKVAAYPAGLHRPRHAAAGKRPVSSARSLSRLSTTAEASFRPMRGPRCPSRRIHQRVAWQFSAQTCPPASRAVMVWPASLYVIVYDHGLHGLHGLGGIHSGQQFVTAGGVQSLHISQPLRILYGKQGSADAHVLRSRGSGGHGQ